MREELHEQKCYVFSAAAGHVDRKVVAQTLPEALVWLWRGYPQ